MFWRILNNLINKFSDNETRCFLRNSVHDRFMYLYFIWNGRSKLCWKTHYPHPPNIPQKGKWVRYHIFYILKSVVVLHVVDYHRRRSYYGAHKYICKHKYVFLSIENRFTLTYWNGGPSAFARALFFHYPKAGQCSTALHNLHCVQLNYGGLIILPNKDFIYYLGKLIFW